MDKQRVYKRIHDIAHELSNDKSTFTRADLAYELHDDGIEKDSSEIGRLVYEAYNFYKNDKAIKNAFYDNENKSPLVSVFQIDSLIESNDCDALFPLLQSNLDESKNMLDLLDNTVINILSGQIETVGGRTALNTIVGTQGAVNVQNEAKAVFDNYSNLVGVYDGAKHQVKSIMADFVNLRAQICDIYRQFSTMLIDTFGDSIKAVSPELFDFDSVEWLDVQGMLQEVKLDYDRISEKCKTLMSEIQDSFVQSLKSSSTAYKQAGSKQIGLLMVGLNMVSHYMDANSATNVLKQDLVVLKNSVKRDATQIKGDMGRLLLIYKTMNDAYIPKAEVFIRNSNAVLSSEMKAMTDAIYTDGEVKGMKARRDQLLAAYKQTEKEMTDEQMNIDIYMSRIEENSQILSSLKPQYEQAKNSKPSKPFFLVNIFTFGSAGKRYNRDIYDWHQVCQPVISRYEDLQADVKIDTDELQATKESLQENKRQYKKIKEELDGVNKAIMGKLKVNKDVQLQMLPHLEGMVRLLRLAREIASSKLDAKYMKAVQIEAEDTELPESVRQNIHAFADVVRGTVNVDMDMVQTAVDVLSYNEKKKKRLAEKTQGGKNYTPDAANGQYAYGGQQGSEATPQGPSGHQSVPAEVSEEDLAAVADAGNVAVQKAVDLLESWANLKALQEKSAIAHKAYDKKLKKLQEEFRKDMAKIDNKSAVLRESLKKINTAQSPEMLKEGLLSLSGGDKEIFSEKDWDDFLSGNKTIEL